MPGEILARRGHRKCGSDEPVARSLPLPSESPRTPPYHTSSRHGIWCRVSLWFGQNLRLSSPSFTSSGLGGREGAEPKQNLSQPLKLQVAPSSLGDSRQACPSGRRALGERAHSLCSTRAAGGGCLRLSWLGPLECAPLGPRLFLRWKSGFFSCHLPLLIHRTFETRIHLFEPQFSPCVRWAQS